MHMTGRTICAPLHKLLTYALGRSPVEPSILQTRDNFGSFKVKPGPAFVGNGLVNFVKVLVRGGGAVSRPGRLTADSSCKATSLR